ncbi:MAG: histidine phosphatase family protein [Lachnospiraceae bacterium]
MRNGTENQIILIFIRHGKTKGNEEHRYPGQEDEPLSEKGTEELLRKSREGFYPAVDFVFSSPTKRCQETARLLYPAMKARHILKWTEIDFGLFAGKNYEELKENQDYQKWMESNGTLPFPQGESRQDFSRRCEEGFHEMLDKLERIREKTDKKPIKAGIVVHGGTIMDLLSRHGRGGYFDYQIQNGEFFSVQAVWKGTEVIFKEISRG